MPAIKAQPLTAEAFAPYGQVIDTTSEPRLINGGATQRFHDLARIELAGVHPRPLLSIFRGMPYSFPIAVPMVEKHPLGSQAFVPQTGNRFLVVVAPHLEGGEPGDPVAFVTAPGQGVNIAMNTWHAPLTPLDGPSDFVVVDRGGEGNNTDEHVYAEPYVVVS